MFSVLLHGQEYYDLQQVLEIGLERNFDIRIARNKEQISENNATWGNAGALPSLDLSAGYSGTFNDVKQHPVSGSWVKNEDIHNQTSTVGLNVSWTIFDGLSIQTNHKRLKELREMGKLETQLVIENLLSDLISEYYNHIRQRIRLKNLDYALSLSRERLRIVEAHYTIGSKSRLDLLQARVDFNADSSKLMTQIETLYSSGINLNQLMALEDVSQEFRLADTTITIKSIPDREQLWSLALQKNTELLISEENKLISELDYKIIRGKDWPYLRFNGGYGYTNNKYEKSTYDRQETLGTNYGLTLGFTIFDGMNRRREKKNAKIEILNQEIRREKLELSLKADLTNMWMVYRNNLDLINLESENREAAKENYEIALERYRLGDLAGIELREAQNSLLEAEERLLQAEFNTKLCEISLLLLSGEITNYLEL
jgi:Outer membrane protein